MDKDSHVSCSVVVKAKGLPATVNRDKLMIYFQREKNGGGDVKSLVYPVTQNGEEIAVVEFTDAKTARSVLAKKHCITGKNIPIDVAEFGDELFESVKVNVNQSVLDEIPNINGDIDDILEEYGVEKSQTNGGTTFQGKLYQMISLDDRLKQLSSPKQENEDRTKTDALKEKKNSQIMLDIDIYSYMELIMKEELDNIRNTYGVTTKIVGEAVIADFLSEEAETGIEIMQNSYQQTMDTAVQDSLDLPGQFDHSKLESSMKKVKQSYPKTLVSKLQDYNSVLFIADSEYACERAMSAFKRHMGFNDSSPTNRGATRPITWTPNYSSSEELFRHDFHNTGLVVKIVRGDIAEQDADAIVNAANCRLADGAGVTGAIFGAGGREFKQGCHDLMRSRRWKELDIGEVTHTDACGNLRCKVVLHVTGPIWHKLPIWKRDEKCREHMNDLCWNLITYSNVTVKSASLAMPAIGTGIYGVPLAVFCEAILGSIRRFQRILAEGKQQATVKEIRLVNYSDGEARQIVNFFRGKFGRVGESSV